MGPLFYTEHFPLVIARYPQSLDLRGAEALIRSLEYVLDRDQTYAIITDVRAMRAALAGDARHALYEWLARRADDLGRLSAGNALLVDNSPLTKGILNAFYRSQTPPNSHRVVHSFGEALVFCRDQLAAAGALDETTARAISAVADPHRDALPAGHSGPSVSAPLPALLSDCAGVLDLFDEPAFLVGEGGAILHQNPASAAVYPTVPPWVERAISTSESDYGGPLCRIAAVAASDRTAYVVVPDRALVPPMALDHRSVADLPPSLERIAVLLAQGLSDKEIAHESGYTLATTRTYVTRLLRKTEVHSRAEFIALWSARRAER